MKDILQAWLDSPKQVAKYPNPILTTPASPVPRQSGDLEMLSKVRDQMLLLMREARGVGLAAPQVGLPYSLFVMNMGEGKKDHFFVNPLITWTSNQRNTVVTEGCLSMPGVFAEITRPKQIVLEYDIGIDVENMVRVKTQYDGMFARVCQHEIDHLYGIMFFDKLPKEEKTKLLSLKGDEP